MNSTWTNGRHNYYGPRNSSGQRFRSKIYKGIKINKEAMDHAFNLLSLEHESRKRSSMEDVDVESKKDMVIS